MSTGTVVGRVASLHRFPVKSMLGEQLQAGSVTKSGFEGDRAWALIDDETGRVVSVKRPRRWESIFTLTATTTADGVQVRFPDGTRWQVDQPELVKKLSELFGRPVSVASTPPPNATFEESWVRDLKSGASTYFELPTREEDGDELVDAGHFMNDLGTFQNLGQVHLVTTSTTRRLAELAPSTAFEPRRFRPNVVIETEEEGFLETSWQGQKLAIGDVRLGLTVTVPRCVMTTLAQGDLPADRNVLRAITEHNAEDPFGTGVRYPCVGVYANVVQPGLVEVGQDVVLLPE